MVGQLSVDQRKILAGIVNPMMTTLNELFDRVLTIPGVVEVLKPTIDAKLTGADKLIAASHNASPPARVGG